MYLGHHSVHHKNRMERVHSGFDGFWRGFAGALDLSPRGAHRIHVMFRGRDIRRITAAEAIAQDWELAIRHLNTAIVEESDERAVATR